MGFLGLGGRVEFSSDLRTKALGAHQNSDCICALGGGGHAERSQALQDLHSKAAFGWRQWSLHYSKFMVL